MTFYDWRCDHGRASHWQLHTELGAPTSAEEQAALRVPTRWERHGDLVLFPADSFDHPWWESCVGLWDVVARALGVERVAIKAAIRSDAFRTPNVRLVRGASTIVTHVDNGVVYEFDIMRNMFAAGNIREKLRVAAMDCAAETVVDLYAGIGYFTLPFLVHARAARVYACEWNPAAVSALHRNLALNNVAGRCVVLAGDNADVAPRGVAQRVNLGLIPSSERGWPVVCMIAARPDQTGGALPVCGGRLAPRARQRHQRERHC